MLRIMRLKFWDLKEIILRLLRGRIEFLEDNLVMFLVIVDKYMENLDFVFVLWVIMEVVI